jgi:hypothetical protein
MDVPFGTAVALWGTDKGRRALHAQEGKLSLEHIGHGLAAMVMPDGKATGNVPGKGAPAMMHCPGLNAMLVPDKLRIDSNVPKPRTLKHRPYLAAWLPMNQDPGVAAL